MKKRMDKKAEGIMSLSFGMIFSIILIVFFIVVAFIAISHFLSVQSCAKVGMFINDLQEEVDSAWNANDQSAEFKGNLPSGIEKICFSNTTDTFRGADRELGIEIDIFPDKNLFLFPVNKACDMSENNIEHIDVNWITRANNPYCIGINNGKVAMMIEKESNDRLVKIRK